MRALSLSLTDTKTVPVDGNYLPGAELAFAKRHREIAVDAHDLARRAHLRSEDRIDAEEAGEREYGLLDRDVIVVGLFEIESRERLAAHDLGRDRSDRQADDLGDERHCARGARVHFENVDVSVLDCELHIHQSDDAQGKS